MKISFINSVGALALAGLGVSLVPSSLSAADFARGERHASHERRCHSLPHGARGVTYRGERCWLAGGCYYRQHALGGYVVVEPTYETAVIEQPVIRREVVVEKEVIVKRPVVKKEIVEEEVVEVQPVVQKRIVEEPVVEESQEVVTEEPVLEEEDTVVETLPEGCNVVVIGGERCWMRDGVYYRHGSHGYKVCHVHGHNGNWHGHKDHSPMNHHGDKGHMPREAKNHGTVNHNPLQMGGKGGKHDKHN